MQRRGGAAAQRGAVATQFQPDGIEGELSAIAAAVYGTDQDGIGDARNFYRAALARERELLELQRPAAGRRRGHPRQEGGDVPCYPAACSERRGARPV